MARIWLFLPPLLFAGLASLFFIGMMRDDPNGMPSMLEGREVPALRLTPLGEERVLTDALLRQPGVKLLNVWASWCAPCRAEHPMLKRLADEGIPIYGINYKDRPADALAFLAELGNPFAALGADANGRMGIELGLFGIPETFVIDGEGRIVLRYAGPITEQELTRRIRPALAEAAAN